MYIGLFGGVINIILDIVLVLGIDGFIAPMELRVGLFDQRDPVLERVLGG